MLSVSGECLLKVSHFSKKSPKVEIRLTQRVKYANTNRNKIFTQSRTSRSNPKMGLRFFKIEIWERKWELFEENGVLIVLFLDFNHGFQRGLINNDICMALLLFSPQRKDWGLMILSIDDLPVSPCVWRKYFWSAK